jgi:hypothetical protein
MTMTNEKAEAVFLGWLQANWPGQSTMQTAQGRWVDTMTDRLWLTFNYGRDKEREALWQAGWRLPAPSQGDALIAKSDTYIKLLNELDWAFEYTDDQGHWWKHRVIYQKLQALQKEIDKDFSIWNARCPSSCRDGAKP